MRKIFLIFLVFIGSIFAQETVFQSIVKNVSLKDTKNAIYSAEILQKDLTKENFTNFVKAWKKVEANYFAGEIDSDFLDTPRYLDVFNNLKEDLNSQIKRVLEANSDVKTALFKNSFKTINALEIVLFENKTTNNREEEIAKEILASIIFYLKQIDEVYKNYLKEPTKDVKEENAIIINTLVASSYRLKEWRVGNAAGLSSKYKNDFKNSRAEYFLSQNSFNSIIAILEAQKEIVEEKNYKNLYSLAKEKNGLDEIKKVDILINEAIDELNKLKKDDFEDANRVFTIVSQIHDLYYITIIEKLGLKPEILDADGD